MSKLWISVTPGGSGPRLGMKVTESKEETIKMHGEKLFNDRVAFYEVIDELFAGGNLGGVRITGRKMGLQEKRLQRGRVAHSTSSHSRVAVLNELGSTVSK